MRPAERCVFQGTEARLWEFVSLTQPRLYRYTHLETRMRQAVFRTRGRYHRLSAIIYYSEVPAWESR